MRKSAARCVALALSLAVVAALVTGPSPAVARAEDKPAAKAEPPLYPLKKGLKWEWSGTDEGDSCKWVDVISGTRVIDGVTCYELRRTTFRKKADSVWRQEKGVDRNYLAASEDGYFRVGFASPSEEDGVYHYESNPISFINQQYKYQGGQGIRWSWQWVGKKRYDQKGRDETPKESYWHNFSAERVKVTVGGKEYDALCVNRDPWSSIGLDQVGDQSWYTWYVPGRGPVKERRERYQVEGGRGEKKTYLEMEVVSFQDNTVDIGSVTLNAATVEKEVSVESIEAPPGVVTKFKKSRTIVREVSYKTTIGVGAEVEARLSLNLAAVKGELATKVKGTIETTLGEKLKDSETREQEVTVDGSQQPKVNIIWIDVYRTGTVDVTHDGKTHKIPFEFPVGTKLIIRKP